MSEDIIYRWEASPTNDWVEEHKYEYEWVLGGFLHLLTKQTDYIWDTSIDDWKYEYLDEYQYDDNGNGVLGTYYYWNETSNGVWTPYEKDEFMFDTAYNFHDIIGPFYYADEDLYDVVLNFYIIW